MKHCLLALCCSLSMAVFAQKKPVVNPAASNATLARPKLVVGIIVDQMRWDYLYRFYDRYSAGGFKRMVTQGFSAENCLIPYAQTVTAAGHACVYTGSVPAINGIMGNEWFDRKLGREVYCVEDKNVKTVGADRDPMSPRNLQVTTITDELRLATNFESKVIGISIKDRGSILPAGHFGQAYWYADNGNWVTSDYYRSDLPAWVKDFNAKKLADSFYAKNWNTLYPIATYLESDKDNASYEGKFMYEATPTFPHKLENYAGVNYGQIRATPYGNSLTMAFAQTALREEKLGKGKFTDFLAVSFSSTDYVGHQFGPNSIEAEDTYLRLDKELEQFFNMLDKEIGKGQYLVFLSADHGAAHVPAFLAGHNFGVSTLSSSNTSINKAVEDKFGIRNVIRHADNYQLYLNYNAIDSSSNKLDEVKAFMIKQLNLDSNIALAYDTKDINAVNLPAEVKEKYLKGFNPKLGGDIQIILKSGYFYGSKTGTTHGNWYPYDAHIPSVFMGWGVKPGSTNRETYMSDIAATLAALLHIQMPGGCIGKPIWEITNK